MILKQSLLGSSPLPAPNVKLSSLIISGSGQARPAIIEVAYTVENLGTALASVAVKVLKNCLLTCETLDSKQVTLAPNEVREFKKKFADYVTGEHIIIVSISDMSGILIASQSGTYVVGPMTPSCEYTVIFVPDSFDLTTGRLQIQNPDCSVTDIRVKRVQIAVISPTEPSIPHHYPSLVVHSYVKIPTAECVIGAIVPLNLLGLIEGAGEIIVDSAIEGITGRSYPVSLVYTGLRIVSCLIGEEARVMLNSDWSLGQPQTFYFAIGHSYRLEAGFSYFPSLDSTQPVVETGEWRGFITESTDRIMITLGQTTSPVLETNLILDPPPTSCQSGQNILITGRLVDRVFGIGVQDVTIRIYDKDAGVEDLNFGDDLLASATTNQKGRFAVAWTCQATDWTLFWPEGSVEINARFEGNSAFESSESQTYITNVT